MSAKICVVAQGIYLDKKAMNTTARFRAGTITRALAALAVASILGGCVPVRRDYVPPPDATAASTATATAASTAAEHDRPAGWQAVSHGDDVAPNYAVVFPPDTVKTFTITLSAASWQTMQDDLNTNLAQGGDIAGYSPIWVPAAVTFDGNTWTNVGVRYKGQSSLEKSWKAGAQNLPFKVDFDEFEDDYPEIKNQRFFGFGELSLANNTNDPTAMHDTLVYDLLGKAGLPAMRTAAYEVILDHGDGPISLGLYTATEVVDDTGIANFFGGDAGNIYEAAGPGATLAADMFDQIPTGFEKKNHKNSSYADLEQLFTVLHAPARTTDPQAWRAELESIFNVDSFLEWLGIATVLVDWDTYGIVPHNFYLYNDPVTGKLNWIAWDHNDAFQAGGFADLLTFDRANVGAASPLIRFLLDDPVYYARYLALLEENSRTILEPRALTETVRQRAALLAPHVARQMPPADYNAAVADLTTFLDQRLAGLRAFLDQN
jgi:hypothetical protein